MAERKPFITPPFGDGEYVVEGLGGFAMGRIRNVRVKRKGWMRLLEVLRLIKPQIKQVFDVGPFVPQSNPLIEALDKKEGK